MAVLKTIPIHDSKGIKNVVNYVTDEEKTTVDEIEASENVSTLLSYAENIKKTAFEFDGEENVLVSGFNCSVESAPEEFYFLKQMYRRRLKNMGIDPDSLICGKKAGKGIHEGELVDKEAREAYHIIMSFPSRPDLSPQMVHRIGLEFCEKAFPDTKAIVSTHMNTDNLHNHIVRSAYNITTATKYRDTVENLEELRRINDELSLKYGLDIILDRNVSDKRGYSWYESMQREQGTSWKEILKADIKKAVSLAHSWDEYKNIMTQSGYGVKEKGNAVVYYFFNDENKRIRDNKLGSDYLRNTIREKYGEEPIIYDKNTKNRHKKSTLKVEDHLLSEGFAAAGKRKPNLFISRYTLTGRRRSDLELIFLAAIKLINYYKDTNLDKEKAKNFPENPVYQPYYIKLNTMKESLNMTLGLGIKDIDHLKALKRSAGAKMSAKEAELRSIEVNLKKANELSDMVNDVLNLKDILDKKGLLGNDLHLLAYSEDDKRDNYAKFNPMTSSGRRELYTKLSESDYRVTDKYDSISYKECQAILDFLNGKVDSKPDILITEQEYALYQRESYYRVIKSKRDDKNKVKYADKPVSDAQLKAIEKIKQKHKELTVTPTNMFEASQIIAYYNAKNPFEAPIADDAVVTKVKVLISKQGLSLNREHITVNEVKDIEAYIAGKIKTMPSVLKPRTEMKNYQVDQIKELIELKGAKCSIPIAEMSADDYYKMFDYLINLSEKPEILKDKPTFDSEDDIKRKNQAFEKILSGLSSDDQGLLYRYRLILNELLSMGYTEDSFEEIMSQGLEIADLYNKTKVEASDYRWEYRNYSHLEWNLNLAKNKAYTDGIIPEKGEIKEELVEEIQIDEEPTSDVAYEDDNIISEVNTNMGNKRRLYENMFSLTDYYDY